MKKLTLILAFCMITGIFASCGNPVKNETGNKAAEGSALYTEVANANSDAFVLTKEKISHTLDELYNSVSAGTVPEYMSLEYVKSLTTDNYVEYKRSYSEYEKKAYASLDKLTGELPDKCILSHRPEWIQSAPHEVRRYIITDPSTIPEDAGEDLVLFLEYTYYEARYGTSDFDHYYDEDMDALKEKYSDIDLVVIDRGLKWLYLDVQNCTAEIIDIFPGYSEVHRAYLDIFDKKMAQEYEKTVSENTETE